MTSANLTNYSGKAGSHPLAAACQRTSSPLQEIFVSRRFISFSDFSSPCCGINPCSQRALTRRQGHIISQKAHPSRALQPVNGWSGPRFMERSGAGVEGGGEGAGRQTEAGVEAPRGRNKRSSRSPP